MPRLTSPVVAAGSLALRDQPVLDAGGLRLRPWIAADAGVLVTAFTDPSIQQWHTRRIDSTDEAAEMITRYGQE